MTIKKEPFVRYNLDKQVDSFSVRLNVEERKQLEEDKKLLEQPKDSTCLKQLAWLGSKVLHDDLTGNILALVFKNKRKNKRMGIVEFED